LSLVLICELPGFADGRRSPDDEVRWNLSAFQDLAVFLRDVFDGIDMDIIDTRLRANIPFNTLHHVALLVRLPAGTGRRGGAMFSGLFQPHAKT